MSDPDPQQCNCLDGTLLCTQTFGVKKKAGPFTLERHIHVKALKMQGFPNN